MHSWGKKGSMTQFIRVLKSIEPSVASERNGWNFFCWKHLHDFVGKPVLAFLENTVRQERRRVCQYVLLVLILTSFTIEVSWRLYHCTSHICLHKCLSWLLIRSGNVVNSL
jgi:hypothetical protein